jgi:hypothetical protein
VPVTVRLVDSGDLRRLTRDFEKLIHGHELQTELVRALRSFMRPIVADVKASYSGGRHLRPLFRRATHMWIHMRKDEGAAGIIVDGRRMPNHMKKIPEYWEGVAPRWRHPLFGNREHWYDQSPRPSFYRIVSGRESKGAQQIEDAAYKPLKHIEEKR